VALSGTMRAGVTAPAANPARAGARERGSAVSSRSSAPAGAGAAQPHKPHRWNIVVAREGVRRRRGHVARRVLRTAERGGGAGDAEGEGTAAHAEEERATSSSGAEVSGEDVGGGNGSAEPTAAAGPLASVKAWLSAWSPPRFLVRAIATFFMGGQTAWRVVNGRVHEKNVNEQIARVGPQTMGVTMLTAAFVGMVFTIQFVKEFTKIGLQKQIGAVLALSFSRELTPVISAIIMAGRVGSAIAAELGTMVVSEQWDALRVLRTDPIDYLIVPRVLACMIALPILAVFAFVAAMAASAMLAKLHYAIPPYIIYESACKALVPFDIISMCIKSVVFGGLVAIISCGWGSTTTGGAKGVGESTTAAVVISLVGIFVADFVLSFYILQGPSDALKRVASAG